MAATIVLGALPACAAGISFALTAPAAENLYPSTFSTAVPNYVLHSDGTDPVTLTVTTSGTTQVSVDGQGFRKGTFTASVAAGYNQGFTVVAKASGLTQTYQFRCLPPDFPAWTFTGSRVPTAQTYLVQPSYPVPGKGLGPYTVFFDAHGVPVWWNKSSVQGLLYAAVPLSASTLAWTRSGSGQFGVFGLNGTQLQTITGPAPYSFLDLHEFQPTPDGNYLAIADINLSGWDLSALAAAYPQYPDPSLFSNVSIADRVVVKWSPAGELLWAWDSAQHIPVAEMLPGPRFYALTSTGANDVYHMNSVAPTSTGFIVSYRHLDAVYQVDMQNPDNPVILWKLGGTPTSASLTVLDDPESGQGGTLGTVGPLSGQHDARLLADGALRHRPQRHDRHAPGGHCRPRGHRLRFPRQRAQARQRRLDRQLGRQPGVRGVRSRRHAAVQAGIRLLQRLPGDPGSRKPDQPGQPDQWHEPSVPALSRIAGLEGAP